MIWKAKEKVPVIKIKSIKPKEGDIRSKNDFAIFPTKVELNGNKVWIWWETYTKIQKYSVFFVPTDTVIREGIIFDTVRTTQEPHYSWETIKRIKE